LSVRLGPQVQALSRRLAASERLRPDNPRPFVHVVAAAVTDADGRVLIAQRPPGKHLAGGWEFPGGKLESGEAREAGLARELHEELGITIATPRPLIRVRHAYPARDVLLDIWVVTCYEGEPRGLDGQALRWCAQDDLPAADLLPADKPIVAALRLPERLRETSTQHYSVGELSSLGRSADGGDAHLATRLRGVFCASVEDGVAAASAGVDFLVMRQNLADGEIAALCGRVPMPVFALGIELERAWALVASGINEIID
jgi:mutator protein MutT